MRVELELEVMAPLFLAGANQQQAELRSASVRGELRYWLRAVLGGVIGDQDLSTLADLEASVFGSTEFSSPVTVRLSAPDKQPSNYPLLPHRPDAGQAVAFPPGTRFSLILSLTPRGSAQQLAMAAWTALLWLALGGLGRRSRRGAGSVRIKSVVASPDSFPPILKNSLRLATQQADDAQQLAAQIETIVKNTREAFRQFTSNTSPRFSRGLPSFSILRESTQMVVKPIDDQPICWLMNTLSELKRTLGSKRFAEALGGIRQDNFGGDRRASPLHITLYQTRSGPALIFTHLNAKILEKNDGHPEECRKLLDSLNGITVNLLGDKQ